MKKIVICALAALGCETGIQFRPPMLPGTSVNVALPSMRSVPAAATVSLPSGGGGAVAAGEAAATAGPSCQGDQNCLLPEDVIVCQDDWWCEISHTMTPPSAQTKNQGQFLMVPSGKQIWTDRWYVTRALQPNEALKLGQAILFFEDRWGDAYVRLPPQTHEEAIKKRWLTARATDLSDLFKGKVHTNCDGRSVTVTNVRVVTSAGTEKVGTDR